jgi:hypothetical protein
MMKSAFRCQSLFLPPKECRRHPSEAASRALYGSQIVALRRSVEPR